MLFEVLLQALEHSHAEFLVGHFATTEPDGYLGLIAVIKETYQVAQFDLIVSNVRCRTKLHFLHLKLVLLFLRSDFGFLLFVETFSKVHNLCDWRIRAFCDQHQI